MPRKRYLSTNISTDPRIAKLGALSEFAVLVYTWMIPHADDDGTLTADADELLLLVLPGFRWRTRDDVEAAVAWIVEVGLLERTTDGARLRFPPKPFYRYQAYIGPTRRKAPEPEAPSTSEPEPAQTSAEPRIAPEPAQNGALFKSSFTSSGIETVPTELSEVRAKRARAHEPVSDEFIEALVVQFEDQFGSGEAVRNSIEAAMNHKAQLRAIDKRLYLRTWLRRDCEYRQSRPPGNHRPPGGGVSHV